MDTRHMKYILTLAETGNMTRAAEKLYISQPTLSLFLSKYEKELGIELFERKKKAYVLSPAGEVYVKYAKKIIDLEELLEKDIKSFEKRIHLSLVTSSNRDLKMLSSILGTFQKTYPDILCSMISRSTGKAIQMIADGTANMAFVPLCDAEREKLHCKILDVKSEEVLFAAPSEFPFCRNLSGNTIYTLEHEKFASAFGKLPFILHQTDSCISGIETSFFEALKIDPDAAYRSSLSFSIIDMVSNQLGGGFIPCSEAVLGKSVIYFSLTPPLSHIHSIIYSNELVLDTPMKYLISLVQEYADNFWNHLNLPSGFERQA